MEIANLKESFHTELIDIREDSYVKVHWLWDELILAREESYENFDRHTTNQAMRDPPIRSKGGSNRLSKLE